MKFVQYMQVCACVCLCVCKKKNYGKKTMAKKKQSLSVIVVMQRATCACNSPDNCATRTHGTHKRTDTQAFQTLPHTHKHADTHTHTSAVVHHPSCFPELCLLLRMETLLCVNFLILINHSDIHPLQQVSPLTQLGFTIFQSHRYVICSVCGRAQKAWAGFEPGPDCRVLAMHA